MIFQVIGHVVGRSNNYHHEWIGRASSKEDALRQAKEEGLARFAFDQAKEYVPISVKPY